MPGTGPYLQRIQSTDGFATYPTDRPLDGGNFLNFQWAEYDLGTTTALVRWETTPPVRAGGTRSTRRTAPDHPMFASIDYRIGTVMAMNLPTPCPLVITPTAEWKQTGNALTVTLLSRHRTR